MERITVIDIYNVPIKQRNIVIYDHQKSITFKKKIKIKINFLLKNGFPEPCQPGSKLNMHQNS